MIKIILIFCGGGLGSLCRYGFQKYITLESFPLGILTANVCSSFILGMLLQLQFIKPSTEQSLFPLLAIGFCGGFSTFSTFSADTFMLLQQSNFILALSNVLLNVVACIGAVYAGIHIIKLLTIS
ncbi:MAG TPA: fluoride efflux transporter CrcB [Bacteroidia bacterium]|nr:fluoride efflux transporter CrcB [Bacteroidia bacterium]HNT79918.1 fluoride efflux transporter CrcB [Bacteroidia bacterium]